MSEIALNTALGFMERGEYEEALKNLKFYLQENPMNPDAVCARGICHLELGNKWRGKRDILKAINMGSKAAEEYVKSSDTLSVIESEVDNRKIEGFLWFYCAITSAWGGRMTISYFVGGGVTNLIFGLWCLISIYLVFTRRKNCILNMRIFLLSVMLSSFALLAIGDKRFLEWFLFSTFWLIYFFVSRRVKETFYNDKYYSVRLKEKRSQNKVKSKHKDRLNMSKLVYSVDLINFKLVVVVVSVFVIIVSCVLLKKSFDISSAEQSRYEYVTIGTTGFKIDKITGERWRMSNIPGRPDVKIK